MRLWSIHPKYLDKAGLGALWREGLLALNVLKGNTKGYKNHPQLERFKCTDNPVLFVSEYLHYVVDEAENRGYHYDRSKLLPNQKYSKKLFVNYGQICYETDHLLSKLFSRDKIRFQSSIQSLGYDEHLEEHPLFHIQDGGIESWEKVK